MGADCFNELFRVCPVVRYTNTNGANSVYMRHGEPYAGDAYNLFTYLWVRAGNQFHTDFEIYDNIEDARAGEGAWTSCNFSDDPHPDHFGVGYPRDCGKTRAYGGRWYPNQGTGFFEMYSGDNCPV